MGTVEQKNGNRAYALMSRYVGKPSNRCQGTILSGKNIHEAE